ncbi:MAG: DUF4355 domain-containing protein [Planctomycetales bacterium]|nr:DUF4355 domain-containing protein [Planctomycetales bacterium]
MFSPRTWARVSAVLLAVNANCWADPPLAEMQKSVHEAYRKIDRFSISCFAIQSVAGEDAASSMGSIEYRFDRAKNQLAIGTEGVPYLLVQGKRLLLRVEYGDEDDSIYLAVEKPTSITWSDVDEARRTLRTHCPLADVTALCIPAFVLPFLADGEERLFSVNTQLLEEGDPQNRLSFGLGHPDAEIRIGGKEQPNLDSQRAPLCLSTEDRTATWAYAFDRHTGIMTGARGIVTPPPPAEGVPAVKMEFLLKPWHSFLEGDFAEAREVPWELPSKAQVVDAAGLRAAYLAGLRKSGREALIERKQRWEEQAESKQKRKQQLTERMAQQKAMAGTDNKQLKKDEAELTQLKADQVVSDMLIREMQAAIAGIDERP